MPAVYLECETEEIAVERGRLDQADFNAWFDEGPIKGRFKKACMQNQNFRCCYCQRFQETMNNNNWDLEHILCESEYPQFFTEPLNLTVACKRCNGAKAQKDVLGGHIDRPPITVPDAGEAYTIPHPHLTTWQEHLRHTGHLIYEGFTDEGKALISCCELNGKAEEATGLTPGAIRTARAHDFFREFGARVPQVAEVDLANAMIDAAVALQERPLVDRMLGRVERDLARKARLAVRKWHRAQLAIL